MIDIDTPKKPLKAAAAPKFPMPNIEVPEMVRDFAEKGVQQAKEVYARIKSAAEETTDVLEDTYTSATNGRAVGDPSAQAVRVAFRAGEDPFGARPEGRDRDRRADQSGPIEDHESAVKLLPAR